MMTIEQVEDRIADLVSQKLNLPVTSDQLRASDALAQLRLDSMAILELIVLLEEMFEVEIIDEELNAPEQCRDVRSLATLVLQKLEAAGR